MDDLESSTMGGGIPSRVNFSNKSKSDDVALASKADPPIESGAGVFSEPSSVASADGDEETPTTDTGTGDNANVATNDDTNDGESE